MALAFLFAGTAERYSLVQRYIIAHNRRLSDHCAHAVVDEEPASNLSTGMNLNSSEQARDLRDEPSQESHVVQPQPVAEVMRPHRMQSGITDQNFEVGARGRIRLKDSGNIFAHGVKE